MSFLGLFRFRGRQTPASVEARAAAARAALTADFARMRGDAPLVPCTARHRSLRSEISGTVSHSKRGFLSGLFIIFGLWFLANYQADIRANTVGYGANELAFAAPAVRDSFVPKSHAVRARRSVAHEHATRKLAAVFRAAGVSVWKARLIALPAEHGCKPVRVVMRIPGHDFFDRQVRTDCAHANADFAFLEQKLREWKHS